VQLVHDGPLLRSPRKYCSSNYYCWPRPGNLKHIDDILEKIMLLCYVIISSFLRQSVPFFKQGKVVYFVSCCACAFDYIVNCCACAFVYIVSCCACAFVPFGHNGPLLRSPCAWSARRT
jgi:hypothetical protein